MTSYKTTIENFYTAFMNKDAEKMIACYHSDVIFNDPVFRNLTANEAAYMWRMLIEKSQSLEIKLNRVNVEADTATAEWEAFYEFGAEKRPVHNIVQGSFLFKDGKIIKHTDTFNLNRWAFMALGWKSGILSFLPSVKNKIRTGARAGLDLYIRRKNRKR